MTIDLEKIARESVPMKRTHIAWGWLIVALLAACQPPCAPSTPRELVPQCIDDVFGPLDPGDECVEGRGTAKG